MALLSDPLAVMSMISICPELRESLTNGPLETHTAPGFQYGDQGQVYYSGFCERFDCHICENLLYSLATMFQYYRQVHFCCPVCLEGFDNEREFDEHMREVYRLGSVYNPGGYVEYQTYEEYNEDDSETLVNSSDGEADELWNEEYDSSGNEADDDYDDSDTSTDDDIFSQASESTAASSVSSTSDTSLLWSNDDLGGWEDEDDELDPETAATEDTDDESLDEAYGLSAYSPFRTSAALFDEAVSKRFSDFCRLAGSDQLGDSSVSLCNWLKTADSCDSDDWDMQSELFLGFLHSLDLDTRSELLCRYSDSLPDRWSFLALRRGRRYRSGPEIQSVQSRTINIYPQSSFRDYSLDLIY